MSLLSVRNLSKSYGGVPALKSAALDLGEGEVLALMGENGAGKSTLIRILAGATTADGGEMLLQGRPLSLMSPDDAHRAGLRFIHQELNVVPQLSVAENIFLGRDYPRRLGAFVDWADLHRRARAALDVLKLADIATGQSMARLATGQRMLVKVASAFLDEDGSARRIFVMDEPTAALTAEESERLFSVIAELKRRGHGVIYVSHRMDEVLRISDRIAVLRDGVTCATLAAAEASKDEVIELMIGRKVPDVPQAEESRQSGGAVLSVSGLSAGVLRDVTLDVRRGEILGLAGLAGAGPSELLKALVSGAGAGVLRIDGKPLAVGEPADAWRQGIAYVPRERRREGLVLSQDVAHNAALPHLARFARLGIFLDRRRESRVIGDVTRRVRLKARGLGQRVWRLSGGNQQKVAFARAVAGQPRVLLLDEPTRGVDVGARFDIHQLLRELAAGGAAILMASSDLPELLALSDRIAVMRNGRIAGIVAARGLSEPALLGLCYGEENEASHA